MDTKKAPGEDGITGEVYQSAFEIFPRFITAMYNGCLRRGVFPKRWKTANLIPIAKPGKENSDEVSKFRPISLLNTGGKVLEKLLINSINSPCFLSRPHEQKPIRLHASKEHHRCSYACEGIHRTRTRKQGSHPDQPGRQRSIRRCLVASDTSGAEGSRMPSKPLPTNPRLLQRQKSRNDG